jgi:hypothetical protein
METEMPSMMSLGSATTKLWHLEGIEMSIKRAVSSAVSTTFEPSLSSPSASQHSAFQHFSYQLSHQLRLDINLRSHQDFHLNETTTISPQLIATTPPK